MQPAVLNLLPGRGSVVGQALVDDPRTAGVAFTGSTETARAINRALAASDGPIVPFIAETGGQNAMIVDATALPEQVIDESPSAAQGIETRERATLVRDALDELIPTPKQYKGEVYKP